MGLLDGKRALVMGVGNKRSIAWGIATAFQREGAVVAFNYFKTILKRTVSNTETLSKTLAARLDTLAPE